MSVSVRILLTNDDGIDSPGLAALSNAFEKTPGVELWVVAPDRCRSTCSHGMTLSRPVFADEIGPRRFAIDGLPADCVYLAMFGIMPERPHIVVSGINCGANLGSDVIYSGTVAGAREAAIRSVHGVAVSLVQGDEFDRVAASAVPIVMKLVQKGTSPALLLNLNYPGGAFKGPHLATLGRRNYPEVVEKRIANLANRPYYWLGGPPVRDGYLPGTDGWLIKKQVASATLLTLDQTDAKAMSEARAIVDFIEPFEGD